MSGRDKLIAAAIVAVFGGAVVLWGAVGRASPGPARERLSATQAGYSLALLPPGWHGSRRRLVPKLLDPREILSVGTFPMRPGGGGNCGREPVAAIAAMRPGDALLSVQEYGVTRKMRERLGTEAAPPPLTQVAGRLGVGGGPSGLRRAAVPRSEHVRPAMALWTATLPFTQSGRWFDALVYVRGRPGARDMAALRAILAGLRFGRHEGAEASTPPG
jgi:hypothetical protein